MKQVTSSPSVVHVPVDHSAMISMRGIRELDGAALILVEMCPCGIQIVIFCPWHPLAAPSGLLRFPPKARSKIKFTFAPCCLASGSLPGCLSAEACWTPARLVGHCLGKQGRPSGPRLPIYDFKNLPSFSSSNTRVPCCSTTVITVSITDSSAVPSSTRSTQYSSSSSGWARYGTYLLPIGSAAFY